MNNRTFILLVGFVAVSLIIGVIFLVLRKTGLSYQESLATIIPKQAEAPATREKKNVRKVTIQDENTCLDVSSDGIVRSYVACGGEVTTISRPLDPKRILELLDTLSRIDTGKYKVKPSEKSLTLVIETDHGTEIIYIPQGGGGGGGGSIPGIIDLIKGDLPQPTATPGPTTIPTPTLPGTTSIPSIIPSPTLLPGVTPTAVPTSAIPFTCYFQDPSGQKRPYNVSNVICSTEPTP